MTASEGRTCRLGWALLTGLFLAAPLWGTMAPRLSLEEMARDAEYVVHGTVARSWSAWDSGHHAIWTHYEINVAEALKGTATTVTVSEPGGIVGDTGMMIAGAPTYESGDEVILLLHQTPIGYLRTSGWGQGKFLVSKEGSMKTVRTAPLGVQLVARGGGPATPRATALDGAGIDAFKSHLRSVIAAAAKGGR